MWFACFLTMRALAVVAVRRNRWLSVRGLGAGEPSRFTLDFEHFLKLKNVLLAAPMQLDELRSIAGIIGHQPNWPLTRAG